jgi:uncharacterized protein YuzE
MPPRRKEAPMKFSYDEDADVLYVTFGRPKSKVSFVQTKRGDVLRFCQETGQIVGVTILFFQERTENGETIDIPEVGTVGFSALMDSWIADSAKHRQNKH